MRKDRSPFCGRHTRRRDATRPPLLGISPADVRSNASPQGFHEVVELLLKLVDLLDLHVLLRAHFDQHGFHPRETGADGSNDGGDNGRQLRTGPLLRWHSRHCRARRENNVSKSEQICELDHRGRRSRPRAPRAHLAGQADAEG